MFSLIPFDKDPLQYYLKKKEESPGDWLFTKDGGFPSFFVSDFLNSS